MKMLNKKGFVLVETLIVTIFVVALFIIVYQNVIPYIGEYEKINSYDDIDTVYASNLIKNVLLEEANLDYINQQLDNNTYIDITDCNNGSIYVNKEYCIKIKRALSVTDNDYILLTKYDITDFRTEVKRNDFFDSGKLSNFRSYINTLPNLDSFYNSSDNLNGKYRLFIIRTITNSDFSTSIKYANIGVFLGNYTKYNIGDEVTFNPGDGDKKFYVIKNSSSKESTVTLISADNLVDNVDFKTENANNPDTLLSVLKEKTNNWVNAKMLTDEYVSENYSISYDGYRARLLDENDIYRILGCSNNKNCFNKNELFSIDITDKSFLYNNLDNNDGYWLATTTGGVTDMAWTIQNSKIIPSEITYTKENILLKDEIMSNTIISDHPTLNNAIINTDDPSGLYKSTDTNTGNPTYYFRGNVENNYVSFANKIWRIVRINEDGTIRLILQDGISYDEFDTYGEDEYEAYYRHADIQDTLKSWYKDNIGDNDDYSKHVASGDYYCDSAMVKDTLVHKLLAAKMTLYSSYTPTFKCLTDENGYGLINSNIGMITYDEVVYAGGYPHIQNDKYYLYNDDSFWTMSTSGIRDTLDVWYVDMGGEIDINEVTISNGIRPIINLKADTVITGSGTSSDPYTVVEPQITVPDTNKNQINLGLRPVIIADKSGLK